MVRLGTIPVQSPPPAELQKFLASEIDRWGELIERAGPGEYAVALPTCGKVSQNSPKGIQ